MSSQQPSENLSSHNRDLAQLRELARIMDGLIEIPGLGWRIGLDGLLGLIPGIGDITGFLVSGYFVFVATRFGVSKVVLARMMTNILIDTAVGGIPFIGDLFDFAWKANRKNLALLEDSFARPKEAKRASIGFFIVLTAVTIGLSAGIIWMIVALVRWLLHFFA